MHMLLHMTSHPDDFEHTPSGVLRLTGAVHRLDSVTPSPHTRSGHEETLLIYARAIPIVARLREWMTERWRRPLEDQFVHA
jgi:hypothetical protein